MVAHLGTSAPACSLAMYSAYQSGQFASASPMRFSCSPWAAAARRSALATSFADANVVAPWSMRPGSRVVTSWSSQPLLRRLLGGLPGVDQPNVQPGVVAAASAQLVGVVHVLRRAHRVHQPKRYAAALRGAGAHHRHQRRDPRPAGHQQHRCRVGRVPHEPAAHRSAQLHRVAHREHVTQVRRHLAAGYPLHAQLHLVAIGRRGDRVASLHRVAVGGGQPHVDVLSGQVPRPTRHVEQQGAGAAGLVVGFGQLGDPPGQSPWYRCSRHGSP